jgi:hypothetical protein
MLAPELDAERLFAQLLPQHDFRFAHRLAQ